ncbi:DNA cytosine methyltransferase [Tsukamurella tyrosinosolvens]|uniref:DNA cytosine methyltransferase n=1 Tax=Tsukamurella tyrosinosolvens TaxID=57704 RepID=UPI002DD42BDB|nr:DNA cytosine methyltransferase [Tsukamurella tyrosinosolvens]MEC4612791.1 DNA cytosine methyltransferase [Tsukamurella tyrosinosolvens]
MVERSSGGLSQMIQPRVVDLFAGPGGLDVAAHWLGVPSVGIEFDVDAVDTRQAAGLPTQVGDVRRFGPQAFLECNVLAGGPPCQTFTVAGNGAGRRALTNVLRLVEMLGQRRFDEVEALVAGFDDERTGLVLQPLVWALTAKQSYQAIVLEQVPAVLPVWEAMAEVLETNGYGTDTGVLHTEEFGVPQTRRRAVLIARLGESSEDVQLPKGTHRRYGRTDAQDDRLPCVSMREALPASLGEFEVVSNYGSGGNPKNRGRRTADKPAFTVTGKVSRNRIVRAGHEDGRITPELAGLLQTFPRDYPWSGRNVAQQIGNAVPPVLGVHVLSTVFGWGDDIRDAALENAKRYWRDVTVKAPPEPMVELVVS